MRATRLCNSPAALGLCLLGLAAGCSGGRVQPVPVRGQVTYKGQPVAKGRVSFLPVGGVATDARPATGTVQPDGTFVLSSFAKGDGVVPGEYQVVFICWESGPTAERPVAPVVALTPRKYEDVVRSGLTASIPAGARGPLELKFDLTD